jgi:hypothetical protein
MWDLEIGFVAERRCVCERGRKGWKRSRRRRKRDVSGLGLHQRDRTG